MMIANMLQVLGDTLAVLAFWISLVAVGLWAKIRFRDLGSLFIQVSPKLPLNSFTTRFQYTVCISGYVGLFLLLYILLIVIGSIPALQSGLVSFIGQINANIATPAGAALATTTIIPSIPKFNQFDKFFVRILRIFASIPLKSQQLAADIVNSALDTFRVGDTGHPFDPWENTIKLIQNKIVCLKTPSGGQGENQLDYLEFFTNNASQMQDTQRRLSEAESKVRAYSDITVKLIDQEMRLVVEELATHLSCGLFAVEKNQKRARSVLRKILHIDVKEYHEWIFTLSQVFVASILIVFILTSGLIAAHLILLPENLSLTIVDIYNSMSGQKLEDKVGVSMKLLTNSLVIGVGMVPVFLLPLFFGAGAQMHLFDRNNHGKKFEAADAVTMSILVIILLLVLAILPIVFYSSVIPRLQNVAGTPQLLHISVLIQLLPWSLPATTFVVIFVGLSRRLQSLERKAAIVIDTIVIFIICLPVAFFAAWLSIHSPANWLQFITNDSTYVVGFPIVIALLAASLGGIMSFFSRPQTIASIVPVNPTNEI